MQLYFSLPVIWPLSHCSSNTKELQSNQNQMATSHTNQNSTDVWGKGSVRSYGAINGPNQAAPIGINLQANPGQARRYARRESRIIINNQDGTAGPVTTRQILNRPVNNRNVEAGLRIDRAENRPQSVGPGICDIMGCFICFCACCILVMLFIFGLQNYS